MQGYYWAKTPENELLVVLMMGGKGYVPGLDGDIPLDEIFILEPVQWPMGTMLPSRPFEVPKCGAHAAVATHECVILPFAANG